MNAALVPAPSPAHHADCAHYAILCRDLGVSWFAERRLEDACSRETTVDDIRHGQVEHVAKVFAWNPAEHTCDDVTEAIAIEIANGLDAGEPISPELRDFIETHAGLGYARGLRVYDRSFAA